MRTTRQNPPPGTTRRWTAGVAVAVAATAVAGARAVDADSTWYRSLDKPAWQPPGWAFGAVWTPLYASIAWAGGRALGRTRGRERARLAVALGADLALNAAWSHLCFRRRNLAAGLLGTVLLDLGNAHLLRRTAATDRAAALALTPYAAWCLFATALNADLLRRNARKGTRSGPGGLTPR
ncbi:TspO/MBR family protein [Streptomyces sp. NPDC091385]|uniref:TspO/MBR family protein n=1 Tax=Streptomyces sp. NPDC091385 TaxID=3365997 RepID=UPI00382AD737